MNRLLEVGLRSWAVVQVLVAVAWAIGPYGPIGLGMSVVPHSLESLLVPTLFDGLFTGPIVGAHLTEPATQAQILDLTTKINETPVGAVSGAYGDINVGWSIQFSVLSTLQGWIWIGLHVAPVLVLAVMWWLLANAVAQGRRESVFTERNRRRLVAAGYVVLLGAPLISVLTWWFYRAVANSSQIAERVAVPGYSLAHLPWTAIAAGIALIALGQVWKRGAALEHDLGGLV
jgi:hypothetical protein